MLSLSATTGWGDPNKEKNPATAAALTTALVWSNVSDAIPVIAHADSNCKSRLEIILKFSEKYNANVFKVMSLNKMLQADYHNNGDHYNAEKKVKWFIDKEKDGKFKLWLMTDDEKALYALYLGGIGVYYRTILYDYNKSIKYFIEAQGILDNIKNY